MKHPSIPSGLARIRTFRGSRMVMALVALAGMAMAAPLPHSVAHTFFSQSTAPQTDTNVGSSVAIDGGYMALGSPLDDIGGEDGGVVWIHDSATGVLLHRFDNPNTGQQGNFGQSVAISGSRVVIGVPGDNTGASDAGVAHVYDLASSTPAVPVMTLGNPNPSSNDEFGWSVAISGTRVVVGAPNGDSGIADAGCAYVFDLASATPAVPVVQINNPNTAGEKFGHSVSVSGSTVVVSALQEAGTGDTNRVHVFDVASGTPEQPLWTLSDPSPATNDHFGHAIAVSGDKLVVSAPLDDTGASDAGSAYAYDLDSGTPTVPLAVIPNPAPAVNDQFGASVALSGNSAVVGASLDDQGAGDAGSAYLFHLGSGTPSVPVTTFANPGPQSGDEFGSGVAISGTRMIVSAPEDNTGAPDAGIVYGYEVSSGTPTVPIVAVNNSSPSSQEEFATSVAISGNLVVVGTSKDDKGASNAGSVNFYNLAASVPTQPWAMIDNPGPATNDYFGVAVAASGNWVAVSAYQDDTGAPNAGTVYIYDTASVTPAVARYVLNNPAPLQNDKFGNAVAMSGDLVVVGCCENDVGAALNAGSVYVYDLSSPTPTVPALTLDNPGPAADDWFGFSVAISGSKIVVGAHQNDTGATDAGSVFVYEYPSASPVAVIDNPTPGADDEFGYGVAVSGPNLIVGCRLDDIGATDSGSAFYYDLDATAPSVPVATLNHPDPEPEEHFGIAVAISGTRVAIGAARDDFTATDAGCAYVYEISSATFPVPADRLETSTQRAGEWLGFSVAIDGSNILTGAPFHDGNTESRGAAYLFDPDPPSPEMQVEQPPGNGLIGGAASIHFGNSPVGTAGNSQTVVIRNIGTSALQVTGLSMTGGSTGDFEVVVPELPVVLAVDETMEFDVSFAPQELGLRLSTLRITSNASASNPFDITLTGQSLSPEDDTDGDGVNDVAELQMEGLGFDWQVDDQERLAILQSGANATGLYSGSQIQAMHPDVALLPMQLGTGKFKLTISVEKSSDLTDFNLYSPPAPGISVNGTGGIAIEFAPVGGAAFFRFAPR